MLGRDGASVTSRPEPVCEGIGYISSWLVSTASWPSHLARALFNLLIPSVVSVSEPVTMPVSSHVHADGRADPQAYHSAFNDDPAVRQVGNMALLPINTKIRGPAPIAGMCCIAVKRI